VRQALAVLRAAEKSRIYAYVVLSLLVGVRTEEARALRWDHVDLVGDPDSQPPIRRTWPYGALCGRMVTSRTRSPGAPCARLCGP
jgi:integrase